jgi:hypothetical protein
MSGVNFIGSEYVYSEAILPSCFRDVDVVYVASYLMASVESTGEMPSIAVDCKLD